jgi:rubrerythrin
MEEKMELKSVSQILDFAIKKEEEAAQFYNNLAAKMGQQHVAEVFRSFALEELGHKEKLLAVKKGDTSLLDQRRVADLGIGDSLVEIALSPDIEYKQALIVAMKAEKAAFRLYHDLASTTDDPDLKGVLLTLAQEEEAKHKLRFEIEYDDVFLREN